MAAALDSMWRLIDRYLPQGLTGADLSARAQRFGGRAFSATLSYVATSATLLISLWLLRNRVSPQVFQLFAAFQFIAALAASLDPATTKALLIGGGDQGQSGVAIPTPLVPTVAGAKAIVLTIPIVFIAIYTVGLRETIQLGVPVGLACFIGYLTSDARVLLDAKGRHTAAIWAKQGSLSMGLATSAMLLLMGIPLGAALLWAQLLRLAFLAFNVLQFRRDYRADDTHFGAFWSLLTHRHSLAITAASFLSALSGSMDRFVALRMLPAHVVVTYLFEMEILTKFWIIPYLLAPVIFARVALRQDVRQLIVAAHAAIAAAGLALLALALLCVWAREPLARITGFAVGWEVPLLALAIAISSSCQIAVTELQASGQTRAVLLMLTLSLIVSSAAFLVLGPLFGVMGLASAWLLKSLFEIAIALFQLRRHRLPGR